MIGVGVGIGIGIEKKKGVEFTMTKRWIHAISRSYAS